MIIYAQLKIAARRWACARSPSQARCAAANASAERKNVRRHLQRGNARKISSRRSVRSPILLEPNTAQTVAITLHELATNAAKYGALSVPNGHVDLKWSHQGDGRLHMRWTETGGPKVQEPTRKGFGGRIIEQMIPQLNGKTRFDWRPQGIICEITLRV